MDGNGKDKTASRRRAMRAFVPYLSRALGRGNWKIGIERYFYEKKDYPIIKAMKNNADYWRAIDTLVKESELVIDRKRGGAHPRYPDFIYPVDYGYLKNTTSMDGGGIDVWRGTDPAQAVDAIICTVDLMKRDSEIKILIGCTEEEKRAVMRVHNETEWMKGILVTREG